MPDAVPVQIGLNGPRIAVMMILLSRELGAFHCQPHSGRELVNFSPNVQTFVFVLLPSDD